MLDEKILKKKIAAALEPKRLTLRPFAKDPALDLQRMTEDYLTFGHRIEQYIADTSALAQRCLDDGGTVVFEGAQATMLDLDHGTYPFVTSSNPVAGAACVGAGVGPRDIDVIWGVAKAYATRVGAGPFPTELDDAVGADLRERGGEFGTTTGRARRTGWIDLVALRYAARLNTLTGLVITKLDVFSGFDTLRVCTRYRGNDEADVRHLPLPPVRAAPRDRRVRRPPGLERGHHRAAARGPTCPRPRASTSTSSPTSSACRSCSSASAPAASRSSGRRRATASTPPRPERQEPSSSTARSPRRSTRRARASAESIETTASEICTLTMPSSVQ